SLFHLRRKLRQGGSLFIGNVAANRLSLWQSTGKQRLRLSPICTSSANGQGQRQAPPGRHRDRTEIAAIGDLRWRDQLHQRHYRGRGGCVRGVVVEAFEFALDAVRRRLLEVRPCSHFVSELF